MCRKCPLSICTPSCLSLLNSLFVSPSSLMSNVVMSQSLAFSFISVVITLNIHCFSISCWGSVSPILDTVASDNEESLIDRAGSLTLFGRLAKKKISASWWMYSIHPQSFFLTATSYCPTSSLSNSSRSSRWAYKASND